MTRSMLLAAGLAFTALTSPAAADVGFATRALEVDHRDTAIQMHIWYPAQSGGVPEMLGRNAVFKGSPVTRDASPRQGTYPLVVLSHGSGGNAPNLSWIASALAERGMVVVGTNHPGTTSGDSDPLQTVKLWERPADLTALIDAALAGLVPGIEVDDDAIGALGFSLGGYSVLTLAGASVSAAKYAAYCETHAWQHDCLWLSNGGVAFDALAQDTRYEQSNADARVSVVVSVDPALSQAYRIESLHGIDATAQLINLGVGDAVYAGVDAAHLAAHVEGAELVQVAQANHFSFLGECTFKGPYIIRMAGEDPICDEVGNRSRADIHHELKQTIGDFFDQQFADQTG